MVDSSDLKNGVTFLHEGKPFIVQKYEHIKIGRGGAKIKVSVRDLVSGKPSEFTFNNGSKFEEVGTVKKKMQFLYKDETDASFMDPKNYSQAQIPLELLGENVNYLFEGDTVNVLLWDERALSVELPPSVVLEIKDTDPGVKGDSATNSYKPATVSTGLTVKVPLFVDKGEKIRVDTRTGEYMERA